MNKQKILSWLKKFIRFFTNPRFLLCFGLAWIITNGWSYIGFALGTVLGIDWLIAVSGAYMAFLWFPFTPEKVLTVTISIMLLRRFFPEDQKTLAVLRSLYNTGKRKHEEHKQHREEKKHPSADGQAETHPADDEAP